MVFFIMEATFMEKIILEKYKFFHFTQISITYGIVSIVMLIPKYLFEKTGSVIPIKQKLLMGGSLMLGQLLCFYGFSHLSFFVGNLLKSSKIVATVIFAAVIQDWVYLKSLSAKTYTAVALQSVGIISFNVFSDAKKSDKVSEQTGYIAIFIGLTLESFSVNKQREVFSKFKPTTIDFVSSISNAGFACALILVILNWEFIDAVHYWKETPNIFWLVMLYSTGTSGGKILIDASMQLFGQVKTIMITSARRVMIIFLSIFIFGHQLNNIQWNSIGIMVIAMYLEFGAKKQSCDHSIENKKVK